MMMNLQEYFNRINYTGSTAVSYEALQELHRAHLFAIPFENLSIHVPEPIVLDKELLYEKLITQRRGGFCFEQNGLFAWILRVLGFSVQLLDARVYDDKRGEFGKPREHLTLLVSLDKRYLVDVGFGSSFVEPLQLDIVETQSQTVGRFQIEHDEEWGTVSGQFNGSDKIEAMYRFSMIPYALSDFIAACDYTQTSPTSHFTQRRICSLAQPNGRISLTDDKLIITTLAGNRTEMTVTGEDEFHRILQDEFDIYIKTLRPNSLI